MSYVFFFFFFVIMLMLILDLSTYESWLGINKGSIPMPTNGDVGRGKGGRRVRHDSVVDYLVVEYSTTHEIKYEVILLSLSFY